MEITTKKHSLDHCQGSFQRFQRTLYITTNNGRELKWRGSKKTNGHWSSRTAKHVKLHATLTASSQGLDGPEHRDAQQDNVR